VIRILESVREEREGNTKSPEREREREREREQEGEKMRQMIFCIEMETTQFRHSLVET
jgi:hypothetical protein